MTPLSLPLIEDPVFARCGVLLETLSSTLGAPFRLWDASDDADGLTNRSVSRADVMAALEQAHRHGCGRLTLEEATLGVWIRLPGTFNQRWLAFGTVSNRDPAVSGLLIEAARKLIEQQVQLRDQSADLDSCVESLTYGLEEQTWLRSLSNHLTLCSASRTLRDVAAELLPSLRRLVGAESIAILLTKTDAVEEGVPSSQDLAGQVLWDGPLILDEAAWRSWLREQPTSLQSQPLVQNGNRVSARLRLHHIQSCSAAQITRGNEIYGWVVAANRSPYQRALSAMPYGLSEVEFGTVEAGLIEAAAKMLATHGHNVDLLSDREEMATGIIRAMSHAVDARDPYTRGHSERVARYGRLIAEASGMSKEDCEQIYLSGLLHDVGKIGISDAVLSKPGKLTDDEFAEIKRHPEIGARIVRNIPSLLNVVPGILHHHESVDGKGYPHRLQGDAIPLMGRILAVADAYDAMTSNRPYRDGMSPRVAREILANRSGIQWDAELVRAFLGIPEELVLEAVEGRNGWNADEDDDRLYMGPTSHFSSARSAFRANEDLSKSDPNLSNAVRAR